MGILLGAPVWYGNRPFKRTIEELYKLELDYLEFSLDYPLPECMEHAEREELKSLLEDRGMKIAFHSPLDISVTHPREELADASMTVLKRCLDFSAVFQPISLYYNLHLHPQVSTFKLADVRMQIKTKGLGRCHAIAEIAAKSGIVVTVENDLVTLEQSDLILEAISVPNLYFTFDIGHAILSELLCTAGQKRGSYMDYIEQWVEKCGAKILAVHLHDCCLTEKQDHLSIGKGELEFDKIFALLKSTSYKNLLIETFWRNRNKDEMDYEELKRNVEFCKSYL